MSSEPAPTLYIGLDDTDDVDTPGTGNQARQVAALLRDRGASCEISRHQLLNHPAVPMTKHNSANVLHVHGWTAGLDELFALACDEVDRLAADAADPGVCLGIGVPRDIQEFGERAQQELVKAADARDLAQRHAIRLRALWDTDDGIIGALAGVGLASKGQDGRFIMVGSVRELTGQVTVHEVLAAGVCAVRLLDGTPLHEGAVEPADKIRPSIVNHQPVLYVEPSDGGTYTPLRLDKAPCFT